MTKAQYCSDCHLIFQKMGACPHPDKSYIWVIVSMLPYLLPIFILLFAIFTRNLQKLKIFILLAASYVSAQIIKNQIRDPRPALSCKSTFGLPSSHMVVLTSFVYIRVKQSKRYPQLLFWILLLCAQGYSRIQLNYHTNLQVYSGFLYGVVFTCIFIYPLQKIIEIGKHYVNSRKVK